MAKWYNADDKNEVIAYNMEWFREITLVKIEATSWSNETWNLRFGYVHSHPDPHEDWPFVDVVSHTDFDTMKAFYDKVMEWLQSPDQGVFHQKQALEECLRETKSES